MIQMYALFLYFPNISYFFIQIFLDYTYSCSEMLLRKLSTLKWFPSPLQKPLLQ